MNTPEPNPRNEPQVLPPPEIPEERDPREPPRAESEIDRKDESSIGATIVKWVLLGAGILLLLALPFVVIALLKARRRRRRRTAARAADRISGGWSEVIDLATDLGHTVPVTSTRVEAAMVLGDRIPTSSGVTMAHRVDAHVFGVPEPTDAEVEAVWVAVDGLQREFHAGATMWQRLRARFSVRSLVSGRRSARRGAKIG